MNRQSADQSWSLVLKIKNLICQVFWPTGGNVLSLPSVVFLLQITASSELLSSFVDPFVRHWGNRERESEGGSDISSSEASLPGWPAPHPTCSLAGQGRLRVWCDNLRLHWRTGWTRTRPFPGHKNMYENIGIIFIPSKNLFLCEIYLQGFDCSSHICEDCGAPCLYVTHLRQ